MTEVPTAVRDVATGRSRRLRGHRRRLCDVTGHHRDQALLCPISICSATDIECSTSSWQRHDVIARIIVAPCGSALDNLASLPTSGWAGPRETGRQAVRVVARARICRCHGLCARRTVREAPSGGCRTSSTPPRRPTPFPRVPSAPRDRRLPLADRDRSARLLGRRCRVRRPVRRLVDRSRVHGRWVRGIGGGALSWVAECGRPCFGT